MSRRNCAGPHDAGGALTLVMAGQPLHLRRSVELLTNLPAASPSVLGIPEQALHPAVSAPRAAVNHMGQYADPRTAHDAGAITPPAEGGEGQFEQLVKLDRYADSAGRELGTLAHNLHRLASHVRDGTPMYVTADIDDTG